MDLQNNPDNEYLKKSEQLINSTRNINFLQFISRNLFDINPLSFWIALNLILIQVLFYELNPILNIIWQGTTYLATKILGAEIRPDRWILKQVDEIIKQRTEFRVSRRDYMQLLIEAECSNSSFNATDGLNLSDVASVERKLSPEVG